MQWAEAYDRLTQRERDEFARIINRLLVSTFLLKQQEDGRRDYFFVERHYDLIAGYLGLIGWELVLDRTYGIVHLINRQGGSRLQLRLMESVILLLLRLIYEEKRKQLTVTDEIICEVQEIHDKALSLRVREKAVMEKRYLREALSLLRRYSLIDVLDEDFTNPRCRLRLFPSLLFAVKLDGLQELNERLAAYAEGGDSTEADDGDQAG